MKSKKTNKDIIKAVQKQSVRKNYTFRFPKQLMDEFVAQCEENDVKPTPILEQLMQRFLDEWFTYNWGTLSWDDIVILYVTDGSPDGIAVRFDADCMSILCSGLVTFILILNPYAQNSASSTIKWSQRPIRGYSDGITF